MSLCSRLRGVRHSLDVGVRGMWMEYLPPISSTMVALLVNITVCPDMVMSWTHISAVLYLSGTRDAV